MEKILTQTKIDAFERHLRAEERSDATIEKYLHDVRVFFIFLDGRKVEKEGVIAYKNYLSKEYAIASANSMLAALNSFFRFLGWLELCVRQFKVQRKVYVSDEKELSKSEYLRLLETANRRNRTRLSLILQTICDTIEKTKS